ncbi:MAG: ATP:cob(I)alamin adenosyltransferase, partial [Gemmatimonadota bacterium]
GSRLAAAHPERMERKGTLPHFDRGRVKELEDWIDELDAQLTPLDSFILPGGGPVGAQLHVARTICRRAERKVTSLLRERPELVEAALPYMNRLSDLLFTLARAVNAEEGRPEARWLPMRQREKAASDSPGSETDE